MWRNLDVGCGSNREVSLWQAIPCSGQKIQWCRLNGRVDRFFLPVICRVVGRAGGLKFYSQKQSGSLLFWCFSACCMYSILSIQLPSFDRDDVLDPEVRDTQNLWCVLQRNKLILH
jgi:hypothetical protein